jgi:hypothetical protein
MFNCCVNLTYLDIPNFSSNIIEDMSLTFHRLSSLIYLNINNLEINTNTLMNQAFDEASPFLKVCANQPNMKNNLSSYSNIINNCSDICFIKDIKLDINLNKCIKSCKDNGYNYEYNNICYNQCPENTYPISNDYNNEDVIKCVDRNPEGYFLDSNLIYKKCFKNCLFCYGKGNEKNNNCIKCKENYLFLNDSIYNNNCYEKCQNYFYFNESNDYICTQNCVGNYDKLIPEKNKCIDKCEKDNIYKYEYNKICYIKCPNDTIYNEEMNLCIQKKIIETTIAVTSILNENTKIDYIKIPTSILNENIIIDYNKIPTSILNEIAISNYNKIQTSILNEYTISDYSKDSTITINEPISETNYQNESNKEISQINYINDYNFTTYFIISGNNEKIYQEIINNVLLNYDINKEKEIIIKGEDNFLFHITNMKNDLELLKEKNNRTNQFSVIDLGQCENLLKNYYQIDKNSSLLIIKLEKISNILSERSLQYEIYNPYNMTKLNLSICSNLTIEIYTPLIISDKLQNLHYELKEMGYNLFDINSQFYQDICTPYKSSEGTDILLSDRINYIYNNEETTCQSNCKFSNYLIEEQYLKCDCDVKNSEININNNNKFNAKSIYESFYSVLKYSNYKVLKCFKLILKLDSLTKNIGSIITIVYFLIYFIFLIIYASKGINQSIIDNSKNIENSNIKAKNKQNIKLENKKQDNKLILKNNKYKKNNNKFNKFKNPPKKHIKKNIK